MRSRELDAGPFEGARFGLENGLVGMGGAVTPAPASIAEAVELIHHAHGPKAGRMLDRFSELPAGTFVWTRTDEEAFRLGRIAGPWHYDDSADARAVGIHHVRPVRWCDEVFDATTVPAAVAATFERGGRNLQRTHDAEAERRTEELWGSAVEDAEQSEQNQGRDG